MSILAENKVIALFESSFTDTLTKLNRMRELDEVEECVLVFRSKKEANGNRTIYRNFYGDAISVLGLIDVAKRQIIDEVVDGP